MKLFKTLLAFGCALLFVVDGVAAKPGNPGSDANEMKSSQSSATSDALSIISFRRRPSVDTGLRYSSNDWLMNVLATPTSFTLRRIRFHLLSNLAICLAVIHYYPKNNNLSIPMTGHSLLGSSLGLLLSYRTSSAYARFWDARGQWTKTKSTCRNLATMVKTVIYPHAPKASKRFLELLSAYPFALMHLCLGGAAKVQDQVQRNIPYPQSDDFYHENPAVPAMCMCAELQHALNMIAKESKTSGTNHLEALHLAACAHQIESLMDCMSNCEKILRTPVPWTYTRHTSRFLSLWMGTLPFALVGNMNKYLVVAVVALVGFCMLGIEEIAHLIEQPFMGDPLDGSNQIYSAVDDGGTPTLIKRGLTTEPYDIGIPVCSLAVQIRNDIVRIAEAPARRH